MNYKTYAEAKIANPDCEIVTTGKNWAHGENRKGLFEPLRFYSDVADHKLSDDAWVICNPADHCSSLEDYFDAGFELVRGDWVVTLNGIADKVRSVSAMNGRDFNDGKRYILSVAALNGGCKIPAKAEQWTVYNNTMPLCELTDEQVGKLVKHSGCVEGMNKNSGEWGATITPMWNRSGIYRIKPKSERELFIEATTKVMRDAGTKCPDNHEYFGIMFDAGARYKDLTQHFGENI